MKQETEGTWLGMESWLSGAAGSTHTLDTHLLSPKLALNWGSQSPWALWDSASSWPSLPGSPHQARVNL